MSLILDGTNGLSDVDGTAAAPAIRGTDTNTGIFFPAADTIAFAEGGAEVMRIDSSGNVGIGTTATTYNYQTKNIALYDASSAGISIVGGAKILTLTAQSSGGIFVGSRSNDNLIFATNDTERARIDTSGNFQIGTTGGGYRLNVTSNGGTTVNIRRDTNTGGLIDFNSGSTNVGSISTNGSTTAYNTISDYRLKEDVVPMTGALAKVALLKPCTYKWKVDGSSGEGFIAHELQEVVPDCVTGTKDAVETYTDEDGVEQTRPKYQGIDTSFLIATLTAAIQEQQATIVSLQDTLTALTTRITALEGAAA